MEILAVCLALIVSFLLALSLQWGLLAAIFWQLTRDR